MTDRTERVVKTAALSSQRVLFNFLNDPQRLPKGTIKLTEEDAVELRGRLETWIKARINGV